MSAALGASLQAALGEPVAALHPVPGGDINQAYRCDLGGGRRIFVKTHPQAAAGLYTREAEGLAWLAEGGARVPPVLAVSDTGPRWLALAWIDAGRRADDFDAQLGEMLARLHSTTAPHFGLDDDNFIGPLPQPNDPQSDWATFYGEQRLWPMAQRAHAERRLSASDLADVQALVQQLPERVGPPEPPARLHGDLWAGNVMCDARGAPMLIDPACYAGHREIDLAMLALFGRVSPSLLTAYDAVYPRSPGFEQRVSLYQLYPLLVHAALFGGGYGSQAGAVARRYL